MQGVINMKINFEILCVTLAAVVLVSALAVSAESSNPNTAAASEQSLSPGDRPDVSANVLSTGSERDSSLRYDVGDANGDGVIDGDDCGAILEYLLYGGPPPEPLEAGDVNCDGVVNFYDLSGLAGSVSGNGTVPGDTDGDGIPDC
jgi:hypothetical protein